MDSILMEIPGEESEIDVLSDRPVFREISMVSV